MAWSPPAADDVISVFRLADRLQAWTEAMDCIDNRRRRRVHAARRHRRVRAAEQRLPAVTRSPPGRREVRQRLASGYSHRSQAAPARRRVLGWLVLALAALGMGVGVVGGQGLPLAAGLVLAATAAYLLGDAVRHT